MALPEFCACARRFRLVVVVMIGSLLGGLCLLPHVLGSKVLVPDRDSEIHGGRESVRLLSVSVRTVALKNVVQRGGFEDQNLDSEVDGGGDVVASWRASDRRGLMSVPGVDHRIGKRMVVTTRRRTLRTSKPYPCSLPPAACQQPESCCGSACANFAEDRNHCGRCGHICKPSRACCNGKCRRLATDEKNCGRCGSKCAAGTKCLFGLCGY